MFSRFTASARRVMQRAFREAKRCQHDFVGTEHLLYGLCYDPEGPAVTLLRSLGAGPELMLEKIELSLQRHDGGMAMEQFPLSPASKRAFRAAADEAAQFNHQMIGPEHLLLGLLRETECEAAQILSRHGVTFAMVHGAVYRIPPDAYHDAQVRTEERARFAQSDNPTADELEDWIVPKITQANIIPEPNYQISVPTGDVGGPDAQLRRTQMFLGAFGGYAAGHWLGGHWQTGIALSMFGLILAYFNKTWLSMLACGFISLLVAERHFAWRFGAVEPLRYVIALPLGVLFGTFLSDFWRFTWALPSVTGQPVEIPILPTGILVDADTPLAVGALVLAPSEGRWWRARVLSVEGPDQVRIRLVNPDATKEYTVPRNILQLPPE